MTSCANCNQTFSFQELLMAHSCTSNDEAQVLSAPQDRAISSALADAGLGYDRIHQVLFCIECQGAVGSDIRSHLRRRHNATLSSSDLELISTLPVCFPPPLPSSPCNALPYLHKDTGFACNSCNMCCISLKHMKGHLKASPSCTGYTITDMQSFDLGNFKRYFQVLPVASTTVIPSSEPALAAILESAKATMQQRSAASANRGLLSYFYRSTGWMSDAEVERLRTGEWQKYFALPDAARSLDERIELFFCNTIHSVPRWSPFHKNLIGKGKKALYPLETSSSKRLYARSMVDAVKFAFSLCCSEDSPFRYRPSHGLKRMANKVIRSYSDVKLIKFCHMLVTEKVGKKECLLATFLRAKCLKADDSLLSAEEVGRLCSHLIYMMKIVHYEWHRVDNGLANLSSKSINGKGNTWPAFLYCIHSKATRLASKSKSNVNMIVIEPLQKVKMGIVDIDLHQMRTAKTACFRRVNEILRKLLFHKPVQLEVGDLQDDISQDSIGYGIRSANPSHCLLLLRIILTSPPLKSLFVKYIDRDGTIHWFDDELRAYFDLHDELMSHVLFLIHLTSGMPARATELATYTVANGASNSRCLRLVGPRVCLTCHYSKTDNVKRSSESIAIFLDEELSRVVLTELLIIRPLLLLFMRQVTYGSSSDVEMFLFLKSGKKMEAGGIRAVFASMMVAYSNQPIRFSDYRHILKYLSRHLTVPSTSNKY